MTAVPQAPAPGVTVERLAAALDGREILVRVGRGTELRTAARPHDLAVQLLSAVDSRLTDDPAPGGRPQATPPEVTVAELEEVLTEFHLTVIADTTRYAVPGTVADPADVADALHRHLSAYAAHRDPGPAVPQFAAQPSLRARVMQIADQLRRDADAIDADPHLSPLTRHADAEARRTAAARLDLAVTADRATAPRPLISAFEEDLSALRRHAGAAGPSCKDKVRAAVAESERLIREAMDSGR